MPGKQAKILNSAQIKTTLLHLENTRYSKRNRVLFLLSTKCGLRASEIAGATWSMLMDATGNIANTLELENRIAKKQSGRAIPLSNDIRSALITLYQSKHPEPHDPIICSERGGAMTPNAVVHWFKRLYTTLGFVGCSSHSGRRTFVTQAARKIALVGGSLKDVQELAGHRSLQMTSCYIQGNTAAKCKIVNML